MGFLRCFKTFVVLLSLISIFFILLSSNLHVYNRFVKEEEKIKRLGVFYGGVKKTNGRNFVFQGFSYMQRIMWHALV